jgi:hypothetical protein
MVNGALPADGTQATQFGRLCEQLIENDRRRFRVPNLLMLRACSDSIP